MIVHRLPLVLGVLLVLAAISITVIALRLLGIPRTESLYLACLAVALVLHILSRRFLRKR